MPDAVRLGSGEERRVLPERAVLRPNRRTQVDTSIPFPSGILEDRNGDGRWDYLNARIYVSGDDRIEAFLGAANIAARLALETSSLDLPIGFPMSAFAPTDPTVAIVVGRAAGTWARNPEEVFEVREGGRLVIVVPTGEAANRWAESLRANYLEGRPAPAEPGEAPGDSLAELFTPRGLLGLSRGAIVADRVRVCLSVDRAVRSHALIDLAARIALETTGLGLPLAVLPGRENPMRRPVFIGRNHPRIIELARSGEIDLALAPGEGRVRIAGPSGDTHLVFFGADLPGESAALEWVAHRAPFAEDYGKGNLELRHIESDLEQLLNRSSRSRSEGGGAARTLFDDSFSMDWEVDRAREAFSGEVLPRVRSGSEVRLEVRLSEPREVRDALRTEWFAALSRHGARESAIDIRVLSAHKQGYGWIDEILKPRMASARKVEIHLRKAPASPGPSIESPNRWLQELYPIDEVLARDLGIGPDDTAFVWAAAGPTYRVVARDGSGTLCLDESFDPAFVERPLFDVFPGYATARVATGWIRAEVDRRRVVDRRIRSDPETFWDSFQSRGLEPLRTHLREVALERPGSIPRFTSFEIELEMSEPDLAIGIDQERISTLEALHEDIYFNTLLFIDLVDEESGEPKPACAGRIIPRIQPSREGSLPRARIRLVGPGPDSVSPRVSGPPARARIRGADLRAEGGGVGLLARIDPGPDTDAWKDAPTYRGVDRIEISLPRPGTPDRQIVSLAGNAGPAHDFPRLEPKAGETGPIVAWDTALDSQAAERSMSRLAALAAVRPFRAGSSFLGTTIWALDVTAPLAGRYISQPALSTEKPVLFLMGRQHGNEVSSTTHILRLVEELAAPDPERLLDRVSLVVLPITNPDGADLASELARLTPDFMLHAGYYGCLGVDVVDDQWSDAPIYPESRIRRDLWEMWIPDVVLDPHGYPSHEWVQLFGGYSGWFRSRDLVRREWWIPRGAFLGSFGPLGDKRFPLHDLAAEIFSDAITRALARTLPDLNAAMYRRYLKYVAPYEPSSACVRLNLVPVYERPPGAGAPERDRSFRSRRPEVTVFEAVIELPDETARGPALEALTRAGVEASLACLRLMAQSENRVSRTWTRDSHGTTFRIARARPPVPGAGPGERK
jgi:hypothetical protein